MRAWTLYSARVITYKCPKCGGSDYYMSKRNVQTGMGAFHRGEFKVLPVCKQCDELMLNLHSNRNAVNKFGHYGLIFIGVVFALIFVGWIIS
jgi:hypothetical protein